MKLDPARTADLADKLTIEVAIDGSDDWQPFVWVSREEYDGTTPVCGRCGLPVASLFGAEPGYWRWDGEGLGRCLALCARHVGVPDEATPPAAA